MNPQNNAENPDEKLLPTDLPKEIPAHASPPPQSPHPHHTHAYRNEQPTVKTLIAWQAPGRPYRKKGKEYYINGLLIALLVEVILFLFGQYLLMMVVASLLFVAFALAMVPPHDFHYRISTEAITIEDHSYLWEELYDFYFKRRDGYYILHVRTRIFIPGELIVTLGDLDKEHVKSVLLPYIPFREVVKPTFMEKSGDWLSKNFPLEKHSRRVAS